MRAKKAALVVNPRTGQNVTKLPDVLAVLSAAGWKTNIGLKEFGGHSMALARQASQDKSDLVIAYGGDGTVNQVVNGVMNAPGKNQRVGVIPGGTANLWAGDIGVPSDPVKAALALVNSEPRKVDIGRVEVQSLTFPQTPDTQQPAPENGKQKRKKNSKKRGELKNQGRGKMRNHFLLMAGLGFDAQVMQGVSTQMKHNIGPLAVGLQVAKDLPEHKPFPIEIHNLGKNGEDDLLWQGEALQVIVGNTRRYAIVLETTPNAYIDDGVLDVCVITGGDPLSTMQQVSALLLRRKPDNTVSEAFQGAHLVITVPASVPLELDGSAVKLKDYLGKADAQALQQETPPKQVMVTYRFDAMPHALAMAIPCTYNGELFENSAHSHENSQSEHNGHADAADTAHQHGDEVAKTALQEHTEQHEAQPEHQEAPDKHAEQIHQELPELISNLLGNGRKVTVVGKAPNPDQQDTYVIAGTTQKLSNGDVKPVAVVVNGSTTIFNHEGAHAPATAIQDLQEGSVIVVEGKQSKRGVIQAGHLVL